MTRKHEEEDPEPSEGPAEPNPIVSLEQFTTLITNKPLAMMYVVFDVYTLKY